MSQPSSVPSVSVSVSSPSHVSSASSSAAPVSTKSRKAKSDKSAAPALDWSNPSTLPPLPPNEFYCSYSLSIRARPHFIAPNSAGLAFDHRFTYPLYFLQSFQPNQSSNAAPSASPQTFQGSSPPSDIPPFDRTPPVATWKSTDGMFEYQKTYYAAVSKQKLIEFSANELPMLLETKRLEVTEEMIRQAAERDSQAEAAAGAKGNRPKSGEKRKPASAGGATGQAKKKDDKDKEKDREADLSSVAHPLLSGVDDWRSQAAPAIPLSGLAMIPHRTEITLDTQSSPSTQISSPALPDGFSYLSVSLSLTPLNGSVPSAITAELKPIRVTIDSVQGLSPSPMKNFSDFAHLYRPTRLKFDFFHLYQHAQRRSGVIYRKLFDKAIKEANNECNGINIGSALANATASLASPANASAASGAAGSKPGSANPGKRSKDKSGKDAAAKSDSAAELEREREFNSSVQEFVWTPGYCPSSNLVLNYSHVFLAGVHPDINQLIATARMPASPSLSAAAPTGLKSSYPSLSEHEFHLFLLDRQLKSIQTDEEKEEKKRKIEEMERQKAIEAELMAIEEKKMQKKGGVKKPGEAKTPSNKVKTPKSTAMAPIELPPPLQSQQQEHQAVTASLASLIAQFPAQSASAAAASQPIIGRASFRLSDLFSTRAGLKYTYSSPIFPLFGSDPAASANPAALPGKTNPYSLFSANVNITIELGAKIEHVHPVMPMVTGNAAALAGLPNADSLVSSFSSLSLLPHEYPHPFSCFVLLIPAKQTRFYHEFFHSLVQLNGSFLGQGEIQVKKVLFANSKVGNTRMEAKLDDSEEDGENGNAGSASPSPLAVELKDSMDFINGIQLLDPEWRIIFLEARNPQCNAIQQIISDVNQRVVKEKEKEWKANEEKKRSEEAKTPRGKARAVTPGKAAKDAKDKDNQNNAPVIPPFLAVPDRVSALKRLLDDYLPRFSSHGCRYLWNSSLSFPNRRYFAHFGLSLHTIKLIHPISQLVHRMPQHFNSPSHQLALNALNRLMPIVRPADSADSHWNTLNVTLKSMMESDGIPSTVELERLEKYFAAPLNERDLFGNEKPFEMSLDGLFLLNEREKTREKEREKEAERERLREIKRTKQDESQEIEEKEKGNKSKGETKSQKPRFFIGKSPGLDALSAPAGSLPALSPRSNPRAIDTDWLDRGLPVYHGGGMKLNYYELKKSEWRKQFLDQQRQNPSSVSFYSYNPRYRSGTFELVDLEEEKRNEIARNKEKQRTAEGFQLVFNREQTEQAKREEKLSLSARMPYDDPKPQDFRPTLSNASGPLSERGTQRFDLYSQPETPPVEPELHTTAGVQGNQQFSGFLRNKQEWQNKLVVDDPTFHVLWTKSAKKEFGKLGNPEGQPTRTGEEAKPSKAVTKSAVASVSLLDKNVGLLKDPPRKKGIEFPNPLHSTLAEELNSTAIRQLAIQESTMKRTAKRE